MSEKIYLKIDQKRYVKKPKVTIGDVMTVYCSDKDMIEKIGHITLVEFTLGKYDRKVLDALDVVGIIQKEYPVPISGTIPRRNKFLSLYCPSCFISISTLPFLIIPFLIHKIILIFLILLPYLLVFI